MKFMLRCLLTLLAIFMVAPGMAATQKEFTISAYDLTLKVFSEKELQSQLALNPDLPRTDSEVLVLAEKLYPPAWQKDPPAVYEAAVPMEKDQEYELGLLFAALRNPTISDATRTAVNQIILNAIPPLPKTYKYGHFKFYYTDSDPNPDHNVTLSEIRWTANQLQNGWNKYVEAGFKEPKHYLSGTAKRIDVKVYYLGSSLLGQTGSGWNHIELNSKYCVKDYCKRRTTSNHELFHRVQYSYGYISGTANMKWIVEGTASWSQKFTYRSIRDYMARMNSGLSDPDKKLITDPNARSYDACHFWVYLDEAATKRTYPAGRAIRDVWATYETNGKNAKAAVETVANLRVGSPTFDNYVIKWTRANYCKDFANASSSWKHDYTEDEVSVVSCSNTYGPLSHVPKTSRTISSNSTSFTLTGNVKEYGADFYEFTIGPSVTNIKITLDGADTGDFAYEFIPIKEGEVKTYSYTYNTDHTHTRTITAGQYDKYGLIVLGRSKGGNYTVRVGP